MITILILTQIIRLIQNAVQLKYLANKKQNDEVVKAWNKLEKAIDRLNENNK
jgi:hypothetical protein